jgi:DNA-binding XRE family transcriptional regulator
VPEFRSNTLTLLQTLGTVARMEIEIPNDLLLLAEGRQLARSGRGARIRRRAGLSQGELAELVGVDASTISRWESGERAPRSRNAGDYARALRALSEFEP